MTTLDQPFELRSGLTLPNRLAKAALSEQLGDRRNGPTDELIRLYQRWGQGGTGLIITGNVLVSREYLAEPANVAVSDERDLPTLQRWAEATKAGGSVAIVQINHPGRQTPRHVVAQPVAPSAVPLKGMGGLFAKPRALTTSEVQQLITAYAETARIMVKAGFDGVQLHGAHGYLISQFLSPLTNQRTDIYGGNAENRRRFLLEMATATRAAIGPDKVLSVKINSADFQRGGFTEEESIEVARALNEVGIDLLEISGGTYEKAAMMGVTKRESTRQREAYFLEFAEKLRAEVPELPLMVTGGFRTRTGMDQALTSGALDVIGLGRPYAVAPESPLDVLHGRSHELANVTPKSVGIRKIDGMAETVWYTTQLWRMGAGKDPAVKRPSIVGVVQYLAASQVRALRGM